MLENQENELKRLVSCYSQEMEDLRQRIALHRSGKFSPGYIRKQGLKEMREKKNKLVEDKYQGIFNESVDKIYTYPNLSVNAKDEDLKLNFIKTDLSKSYNYDGLDTVQSLDNVNSDFNNSKVNDSKVFWDQSKINEIVRFGSNLYFFNLS